MKKIFTLIAAALMAVGAQAQDEVTWNFAGEYADQITAMLADGNVWESNGTGARNKGVVAYETLKASGNVLDIAKGLKFEGPKQRFLFRSGTSLQINASGLIAIPNLKKGYTVICNYKPAGTGQRYIKAANLNVTAGFAPDPEDKTTAVEATGTVIYDGAVVLTGMVNNVNISSITVKDENGTVLTKEALYALETATATASPSKTWDFTASLSADDAANLAADATNWTAPTETNTYYASKFALAKEEAVFMKANDKELALTFSLLFFRSNGTIGENAFRVSDGNYFYANNSNICFIIPAIKKGDVIEIDYYNEKTDNDKILEVMAGATITSDVSTSKTPVTAKLTATLNGEVVVKQSTNFYYTAIRINPSPTGIQSLESDKAIVNDGVMYNLSGQKVNKSYKGVVIMDGKKMLNK